MTVATAPRTNANASTETRLARDIDKDIMHLGEPTDTPLMTLLGGYRYEDGGATPKSVEGKISTQKTTEVTFEVIEKNPLSRVLYLYGTHDASTTTIEVYTASTGAQAATDTQFITIGDVLHVKETGEEMFVIAKGVDGYSLTCRRGIAGSTATTHVAGETVYISSYACKEGAPKRTITSMLGAARTVTTQILRRTFGVTKTMEAVETLVNPKDWSEEMNQAAYNLKLDCENAAWYCGGGSTTDANSNAVLFMSGAIPTISTDATRVLNCGGALTETLFFQYLMPQIFQYGPKVKTLFADAKLVALISGWPAGKAWITQKETEFGIDVQVLKSTFGTLNIILCGAFSNFLTAAQAGYGVVLDLKNIIWRPLRNWKMEEDVQTPGDDTREAQIIVEAGLMVKMIQFHSIITNIG
jgi:hypothetical protein